MKISRVIAIVMIFTSGANHFLKAQSDITFEEKVNKFMKPYVDNRDFDGYLLIERSDNIILSKGFGKVVNQCTENSQFMIGSVTKTFTAEAIALLINQRKMSLNDLLTELAPDLPNAQRISIENLLVHSSGIKDYYAINEFNSIRNEALSSKDFVKWISQFDLDFEPGERNSYSNSGYNLLALQIESVSGLKYSDFLETHVLNPLRMNSTGSLEAGSNKAGKLVQGFSPGSLPTLLSEPTKIHPSWLIGSGSVFSSAKDLLKWCSVIETRINEDSEWTPYGWGVRSRDAIQYLEQNGRILGYSSIIQIYPSIGLNIIVLSRIESDAVNSIARGITSMLFNEDVATQELRKVEELPAHELSEYSGTYQFAPDFFVTLGEKNGALGIAMGSGENLEFSILDYLGNDDFFFRVTYNSISFNRDENGKISGINWAGSGPFPKVSR